MVQLIHDIYCPPPTEDTDKEEEEENRDGFAVHLHAPWGAGKSSVLKIMQALMTKGMPGVPPFTVVWFNAWDNEHRKPPWWPLIQATKEQCVKALADAQPHDAEEASKARGFTKLYRCTARAFRRLWDLAVASPSAQLNWSWFWWKATADWAPAIAAIVAVALVIGVSGFIGSNNGLGDLTKAVIGLGGAISLFFALGRSLVFGSPQEANRYFDLSRDPLKIFKRNFGKLVEKALALAEKKRASSPLPSSLAESWKGRRSPLCIIIDDLDRCSADYVVDLLEGIQTSFRHKDVVYIVAADRDWIRSSFRQRDDQFADHIGTTARPIGYLFLEKIFQLSTPLPGMSTVARQRLWDDLLGVDERAADTEDSQTDDMTEQDLQERTASMPLRPDDNLEKVLSSPAATPEERNKAATDFVKLKKDDAQVIHFLRDHVDLLPPNPRFMKRVLNAYQMRKIIRGLEAGEALEVSKNALVRWTVLEQSYPELASHFEEHPQDADPLARGELPEDLSPTSERGARHPLTPFLGDQTLRALLKAEDPNDSLSSDVVGKIVQRSLAEH